MRKDEFIWLVNKWAKNQDTVLKLDKFPNVRVVNTIEYKEER